MKLIIIGAPGAGKGTQAEKLSEKLNIPHISTGDIFRSNISDNTQIGKQVRAYMDKGNLVPDELTIEIVKRRLQEKDCANGFILDGFPRTIPQAEYLDKAADELNVSIDAVLDIVVSDKEVIKRILGRRVCPSCGMSYHISNNPPLVEGICDVCHSHIELRDDDKEEILVERLKVYHEQTEPVINYYQKNGKLVVVNGRESLEDTTADVFKALGVSV
jgi:adenylate kinase